MCLPIQTHWYGSIYALWCVSIYCLMPPICCWYCFSYTSYSYMPIDVVSYMASCLMCHYHGFLPVFYSSFLLSSLISVVWTMYMLLSIPVSLGKLLRFYCYYVWPNLFDWSVLSTGFELSLEDFPYLLRGKKQVSLLFSKSFILFSHLPYFCPKKV